MANDNDWNGNQKGMGNTPLKPFRDPITKRVVPQNPQGDAYPVGGQRDRGNNLQGDH